MSNEQTAKRINERLQSYWGQLRENRVLPFESDIQMETLQDVWDSCFLMRRSAEKPDTFIYIYLGNALLKAYDDKASEQEICEHLAYASDAQIIHHMDEVLQSMRPVEQEGEFVNSQGLRILHRSVLLPFATSQQPEDIIYILGGMRWKAYL